MNTKDLEDLTRKAWVLHRPAQAPAYEDLDGRTRDALIEAARLGYLAGEEIRA